MPSALSIVEVIPTQRTTAAIAALEPAEQAHRMECILARSTLLVRRSHIGADDTVANSTLRLASQCTLDIPSKSNQTFNEVAGRENDDLECPHPRLPILV